MDELYSEWSVKGKNMKFVIPAILLLTVFLGIGFVLVIAGSTVGGYVFAIAIIAALLGYRFFKVEYEYIFVTNEIRFDRIYSGSIRKHAETIQTSEISSFEKVEWQTWKKPKSMVLRDYSSGTKNENTYAFTCSGKKGRQIVLFEPSEKMLQQIKKSAPKLFMKK